MISSMQLWLTGKLLDMEGFINIKTLNLDELAGVVNIYPWFSAARIELCRRMNEVGGNAWGKEQYADAALYINSRRLVADCIAARSTDSYSDEDVNEIVKSYITRDSEEASKPEEKESRIRVVGGDYFSQDEYEKVVKKEDKMLATLGLNERKNISEKEVKIHDEFFYTETLAQIYVEQGYYDIAIKIYSKLSLAYPEKNAYFATLIEKLQKAIKN